MEVDPVEFAALRRDVADAATAVATLTERVEAVHGVAEETLRNTRLTNGRVTDIEKQMAVEKGVDEALAKIHQERRVENRDARSERRADVRAFIPGLFNTLLGATIATLAALALHFLG